MLWDSKHRWQLINRLCFSSKLHKASEGSPQKLDAQKQLLQVLEHRSHVDKSVRLIGNLLFGSENGPRVLESVGAAGQPLVDDWSCLKSMVDLFAHSFLWSASYAFAKTTNPQLVFDDGPRRIFRCQNHFDDRIFIL